MLDTTEVAKLTASPAPIVLSVMRNELARLPRWFEHYRAMGITQFIVVDNGSSDGTTEFLRAQPDLLLLHTEDSYLESNFGMTWVNDIRRRLPPQVWTLFVDADEYLVYEGWPGRGVAAYVAQIPDACDAVPGFMLDMYPKGDIKGAGPGDDLLTKACYFDTRYHFRKRPLKPWRKDAPAMEVVGGPRVRLFSTLEREQRTTWLTYWIRGQLDRLLAVAPVGWRRTIIENFPQTPPALKKVPLLRGHGPQYLNAHDIDHGVYHQTNGVLLHFKFTADFAEKIEREIQRQEHYRFGAEYILYNKYILRQGPIALYSESESGTFETAEDLIRLKLIRDVSEYFS